MQRLKTTALALIASLTIASHLPARAASSSQCVDLVKECFAYAGSPRDNCFSAVSKHPFCRESDISALALKRAGFSALLPSETDAGPSLVGPQLVDRECVNNFDNSWLSTLVKGEPSPEAYANLHRNLERCARTPASDVMRP